MTGLILELDSRYYYKAILAVRKTHDRRKATVFFERDDAVRVAASLSTKYPAIRIVEINLAASRIAPMGEGDISDIARGRMQLGKKKKGEVNLLELGE